MPVRSPGQVQRGYGKELAAAEQLGAGRNLLYNGDFRIAQRGTSFTSSGSANSDDSYTLDRWLLLSDGDDIVDVGQETTEVPSNAYSAISLDVETANKEFGIVQILENRDIQHVIGDVVSLSFEAKISAGGTSIANLRAAVVSCNATADTVTSDMVSSWGGDGSANPTLISGAETWTFENTPANLATPTTTYQRYVIENISVDTASTNNIAVFIWVNDVSTTIGHILYISKVQLEAGSIATPFERRPFTTELALCQRYYCKTFVYGTAPAQNAGVVGSLYSSGSPEAVTPGLFRMDWEYPMWMRAAPAHVLYNPSAANNSARNTTDGSDTAVTTVARGENGVSFYPAAAQAGDAGDPMRLHVSADIEL
jgi:hypothetical protein